MIITTLAERRQLASHLVRPDPGGPVVQRAALGTPWIARSPGARALYLAVAASDQTWGGCLLSLREMAAVSGMTLAQVRVCLGRLERDGFIARPRAALSVRRTVVYRAPLDVLAGTRVTDSGQVLRAVPHDPPADGKDTPQ